MLVKNLTLRLNSRPWFSLKNVSNFVKKSIFLHQRIRVQIKFTQDHTRNLARKGCGTHWTYSVDADIVPSNEMADKLQEFYANQKKQGKLCTKYVPSISTCQCWCGVCYRYPIYYPYLLILQMCIRDSNIWTKLHLSISRKQKESSRIFED